MTALQFEPLLGRELRSGGWDDQSISTDRKIRAAAAAGRVDDVVALTDHFITEAEVCYRLYRQWTSDLAGLLVDWGVPAGEVAALRDRLADLLAHPDGHRFDAPAQWDRVLGARDAVIARVARPEIGGRIDVAALFPLLDELRESWRQCHDRDVDTISGLMNEVIARFGESAIGAMYDRILRPWFEQRYTMFDVDEHSWADATRVNLLVAFEAMRGHLCGPGRRGDIDYEELPDRWVLRFDPCGSGGRSLRGDVVEGTPPRQEPPYDWPLTAEPAPWNHFSPGVCTYCAHCVMLTEIMPMEAFGYPVRAVDPPRPVPAGATPQRCAWTVFKDPTQVPDAYYDRVGMTRPAAVGSRACGGRPSVRPAPTDGPADNERG